MSNGVLHKSFVEGRSEVMLNEIVADCNATREVIPRVSSKNDRRSKGFETKGKVDGRDKKRQVK